MEILTLTPSVYAEKYDNNIGLKNSHFLAADNNKNRPKITI
jgi:hypothetical protein